MNQSQNQVKPDKAVQLAVVLKQALQLIQTMQVPFMHPKKFAEHIGVSSGVVGGWIDLGYVPTKKIGKYRMINMVAITADLVLELVDELKLDDLIVVEVEQGVVS